MTFYLTDAFGSATPQATLTQKWQQHVAATYHPEGSVQGSALCTHVSPDPASQKAMIGAIDQRGQGEQGAGRQRQVEQLNTSPTKGPADRTAGPVDFSDPRSTSH